jgi:hypothetical protein
MIYARIDSLLPPWRLCQIPFMVREPHHERYCMIVNSSIYPFVLSLSKGERLFATQSLTGEENRIRTQHCWSKSLTTKTLEQNYANL